MLPNLVRELVPQQARLEIVVQWYTIQPPSEKRRKVSRKVSSQLPSAKRKKVSRRLSSTATVRKIRQMYDRAKIKLKCPVSVPPVVHITFVMTRISGREKQGGRQI